MVRKFTQPVNMRCTQAQAEYTKNHGYQVDQILVR